MPRPLGSKNKQPGVSNAQRQRRYRARVYLKDRQQLQDIVNLLQLNHEEKDRK